MLDFVVGLAAMTPNVRAEALGQTDEEFVERADLIDQMEAPDLAHVGGLTIPQLCASLTSFKMVAYRDRILRWVRELGLPSREALHVVHDLKAYADCLPAFSVLVTTSLARVGSREAGKLCTEIL